MPVSQFFGRQTILSVIFCYSTISCYLVQSSSTMQIVIDIFPWKNVEQPSEKPSSPLLLTKNHFQRPMLFLSIHIWCCCKLQALKFGTFSVYESSCALHIFRRYKLMSGAIGFYKNRNFCDLFFAQLLFLAFLLHGSIFFSPFLHLHLQHRSHGFVLIDDMYIVHCRLYWLLFFSRVCWHILLVSVYL